MTNTYHSWQSTLPDTSVIVYMPRERRRGSQILEFTLAAIPGVTPLTINPLVNSNYVEDDWWTAHDLSFQSTTDSPLQWTVGGFFFYQHYNQPYEVNDPLQPQLAQPFLAVGGPAAAPNPNHDLLYLDYDFSVESAAGYGQVSYKINDKLTFTYLATIGTLGPLLGLVGTVSGMIGAFRELSGANKLDVGRLAGEFSHALVVTLAGVAIAVPAIFFYAFFKNRLTNITQATSNLADDLLTQMYHNSKKAAPAPAAAGEVRASTAVQEK